MTAGELPLWPDEEDLELPLDDTEQELADAQASDAVRDKLVDELAACLSWAEGRTTPNASRVRYWRTLVGRPAVVGDPGTPEARRDDGIARAAAKWTDEEVNLVDLAIVRVRNRVLKRPVDGLLRGEFTTADVWQELNGTVPVTKGIAGRMTAAKSARIIANTGSTVIIAPDAPPPNNGQRLTVWRAL